MRLFAGNKQYLTMFESAEFTVQWGYHLTKTVLNRSAQPISEILHFENQIVCCIETYFIPS